MPEATVGYQWGVLFRVLGPLAVEGEGGPLPLGSARERLVLALLLLNADRLVPTERLIDALWADPPSTARQQLHNLMAGLRRRFAPYDSALLVTRTVGYELHLGPHGLDLIEFRRQVVAGAAAESTGDLLRSHTLLTAALARWRGPALADVARAEDLPERSTLEAERRAAVDLELHVLHRLGRPDDVLALTVEPLVADPFDERLHAHRLRALASSGRRHEALASFRRLRRDFLDELGVLPGPDLVTLHDHILTGLLAPESSGPNDGIGVSRPVPREAPARAWSLVGRLAQVRAVAEAATAVAPEPAVTGRVTAPPTVVIAGVGGAGKSAVAAEAAHELADRFPGGTLWLPLGSPSSPKTSEALAQLLRSLGVPSAEIPDDLDRRLALYRSTLTGRRVLVVLDGAESEAEVRPLLPTTPGNCAIVTSRRKLSALVGAIRVTAAPLAPADSQLLLSALIGALRAQSEPAELQRVADLCGHLPLALIVAGARLAANDSLAIGDLRLRLEREHARLDELSTGDIDVRASILASVESLPGTARELFGRLALTPGPEWAGWVAECLGHEESWARDLDELVDRHLVEPIGRDGAGQPRFRVHGLVADVATELLATSSRELTEGYASRLLRRWLELAVLAERQLTDSSSVPPPRGPGVAGDSASVVAARPGDWFEVERTNLVAMGTARRPTGPAACVDRARLALALAPFLRTRAYDDDRERLLRQVLTSLPSSEPAVEGALLAALFAVLAQRRHQTDLAEIAGRQLDLARATGDAAREFTALMQSGWVAQAEHQLTAAAEWYEQARDLASRLGDEGGVARALGGTGVALRNAGRAEEADPLLAQVVAQARRSGNDRDTCIWLVTRAEGLTQLDRLDEASSLIEEAITLADRVDDELGLAHCRMARAAVLVGRGEAAAAEDELSRARGVLDRHAPGGCEPEALRVAADIAVLRGDLAAAGQALARGIGIWRQRGETLELARDLARAGLLTAADLDRDPLSGATKSSMDARLRQSAAGREAHQIVHDLGLGVAALRLPSRPYRSSRTVS